MRFYRASVSAIRSESRFEFVSHVFKERRKRNLVNGIFESLPRKARLYDISRSYSRKSVTLHGMHLINNKSSSV